MPHADHRRVSPGAVQGYRRVIGVECEPSACHIALRIGKTYRRPPGSHLRMDINRVPLVTG